jgi:hypothetical protein
MKFFSRKIILRRSINNLSIFNSLFFKKVSHRNNLVFTSYDCWSKKQLIPRFNRIYGCENWVAVEFIGLLEKLILFDHIELELLNLGLDLIGILFDF